MAWFVDDWFCACVCLASVLVVVLISLVWTRLYSWLPIIRILANSNLRLVEVIFIAFRSFSKNFTLDNSNLIRSRLYLKTKTSVGTMVSFNQRSTSTCRFSPRRLVMVPNSPVLSARTIFCLISISVPTEVVNSETTNNSIIELKHQSQPGLPL